VKNYHPMVSFDAESAEIYDDEPRGDEEQAVAFLRDHAAGGPALELAIGTGRIGLPLAAAGVRVDGIDMSEAMVAKLRAKPGGDAIAVTMGDYADVAVTGSYSLIYVVYNTFYNLLTQDRQVQCFQNVAAHLDDGGVFVVEAAIPSYVYGLKNNQHVEATSVQVDEVWLDVGTYDPVTQLHDETHVRLMRDSVRLFPIVCRYVWPSEMDLMARLAGLELKNRWGGWNRVPFTARSTLHVSVYGR
jgi:SAM-dependent methyltransferase